MWLIYADKTQIEGSLLHEIYHCWKLTYSQKIHVSRKICLFKKDKHIYGYSKLSVALFKIFLTFSRWQLIVAQLATKVKQILSTCKMFLKFSFSLQCVANNRKFASTIPQMCKRQFSTRKILEFRVICLSAVANNRKSIAYSRHTFC